jgi:hypothetical protein
VDADQARAAAIQVGAITAAIGVSLVAAPERVAGLLRMEDARGLRAIGAADLALAPALLLAGRKAPWMAARVGLNAAIAGFLLSGARDRPQRRAIAAALAGLSVQDVRIAAALRTAGR